MFKKFYLLFTLLLVSLFFLNGCKIKGTVTDNGIGVEGVKISLNAVKDDVSIVTVTDDKGEYYFDEVLPGNYEITAEKDGYRFYPKIKQIRVDKKEKSGINFQNLEPLLKAVTILSVPGESKAKTGSELKIIAVGEFNDKSKAVITEHMDWESLDTNLAIIKDYSRIAKLAACSSSGNVTIKATIGKIFSIMPLEIMDNYSHESDKIIPNIITPASYLPYDTGSCIETCIWAILNAKGVNVSLEDINKVGKKHSKGEGLITSEIANVLNYYELDYNYTIWTNLKTSNSSYGKTYENILRDEVLEKLKKGHPVMLSLKYSPDFYPEVHADHYVIVFGYNEVTDEIIYTDMNQVNRSSVKKLYDGSSGYSLINTYKVVFVIEFLEF
ncbi:MAG: carboxypeptidase regulatory-like domain-containing protein [Desulfobacterales bacterium]|nr:carboxypeptidase regulatory-like domain-containing protein [Desulfobacterales bacterium]